ncbi:MAG: hypothetical protein M0037_00110 [Betaproteobacteria bacterium]|nr:hypothetical protein [Betaproteobacteria bacterium]
MTPKMADVYARRAARHFLLALLSLGITGALIAYCAHVLLTSRSTDQRQWTMATLWGVGAGMIGYWLGRGRREKHHA